MHIAKRFNFKIAFILAVGGTVLALSVFFHSALYQAVVLSSETMLTSAALKRDAAIALVEPSIASRN